MFPWSAGLIGHDTVALLHDVVLTNVRHILLCSEFIGEDGNEKFWQFVDTVKELTVYKHGGML